MITTQMMTAFGYDDLGNSPSLLCEKDKAEMERGIPRASGEANCVCGVKLHYHPKVQGALWATRGCTEIVKL